MAEREPRNISEAYRRRIERRLNGLTYEQALSRGISLQRARGHKPREHIIREERRRERGGPTEADRRFIRKQTPRWEAVGGDAEEIAELYLSFDEEFRARLREEQRYAEAHYKRSRGRWKWDIDGIAAGLTPFPPPKTERAMILYYH